MSDEVSHPLWALGRPPFQDYREFSNITPKLYLRYKMKSKKDKMVSTKMEPAQAAVNKVQILEGLVIYLTQS